MTASHHTNARHAGAMYELPDDQVAAGSTLGSPTACAVVKATGALESLYSIELGAHVFGAVVVQRWDRPTGVRLTNQGGVFEFHPDRQVHRFRLSNGLAIRETIFVLNAKHSDDRVDPPAVYYTIETHNATSATVDMDTYVLCQLRGDTAHDIRATYDPRRRGLVCWNRSNRRQARIFSCSEKPTSYAVTSDHAVAMAETCPGELNNKADVSGGDPIGILHLCRTLRRGQRHVATFLLVCSPHGIPALHKAFAQCPGTHEAMAATEAHFDEILSRSVVMTPDIQVNRGVLWAKANMLRVQLKPSTGWSFTNDPGHSNNSVARDTAWYAFGCDYLMPEFSRASLMAYVKRQLPSGKIFEYYDIRNGKIDDYGLNINDNTPLIVLALWHHYQTTGDEEFLRTVYRSARKAGAYILSQRNDDGLVWCTATGTGTHGIAGWRNVIDAYRLSGATTEINSECYAALRTLGRMGRVLHKHKDSAFFGAAADDLRDTINAKLYNKENGLYYLNIDVDGTPCSDVTADLVFPVMFGVSPPDISARIIGRLTSHEFWTTAGIRTVPRSAPNYSPGPRMGYGLLGGVWEAVSFWYAFAAAPFIPDFTARALSASFAHYALDPRRNNTVPGQFSEWLHGETLVNSGMMLSPWFPPRYLWAAIEGAAGLDLAEDTVRVNPRLAPDWKWLAVRNVLFRGKRLIWVILRQPELFLYANFHGLTESLAHDIYDEDVTDDIQTPIDGAAVVALCRKRNYIIFAGNTYNRTVVAALRLLRKLPGLYRIRIFDSLNGDWRDHGTTDGEMLTTGIGIRLEPRGYWVIQLQPEA